MKIHTLIVSVICGIWMFTGSAAAGDLDLPVWRVEIMTPGGALPFIVYGDYEGSFTAAPGSPDELKSYLVIKNGEERIRISVDSIDTNEEFFGTREVGREHWLARHTTRVRNTTTIPFANYGSELSWSGWGGTEIRSSSNRVSEGVWKKQRGNSIVELPVYVTLLEHGVKEESAERFIPVQGSSDWDVGFDVEFAGRWRVNFSSSDDHAIGIFEVNENQIATGTFLTTTGDYRFLEGRVDGPYMRLSAFDGAHAFLFHARMQEDGTIAGDFWSGNWHHETWTAVRDENATLPDAFEQTSITDEQALADAVFKDIDGNPTRVLDALDATNAKARVLEIFGTWCPNCSDAGRELVSLKEKYGDDLGIVGLAFEVTEDFARSSQQVQRHHAHIGSDWEILIAGLSDKAKATETLGFLDRVRSYPTLIFLNADNEVQAVYSGFSGPATGEAYTKQRERFEELIERMINE